MCQLSPAQEEDTAIVSDTTDDLWFLTEGESEQVSVVMKEAALEEGCGAEREASPEDDDGGGRDEKADREVNFCNWFLPVCYRPINMGCLDKDIRIYTNR